MTRHRCYYGDFLVRVNDNGTLRLELEEPYDDDAVTYTSDIGERLARPIAYAMLSGLIERLDDLLNEWDDLTNDIDDAVERDDWGSKEYFVQERDEVAHHITEVLSLFRAQAREQ